MCGLEPAAFGEADHFAVSDHEMVQQAHIHQLHRFAQAPGQRTVCPAGFGDPRRVIVRNDEARSIALQGLSYHFAGVHAGAVDGAVKHLVEADHTVAGVEEQAGEYFVVVST